MPTGPGIGATQAVWAVMSLTRAAGRLPISTVAEPRAIIPGPPGTQPGRRQGAVVSVKRAAGWPPISTVGSPLMMVKGSAGWADGVGTGAGGWIGAWQWGESWRTMSPRRAAKPKAFLLAVDREYGGARARTPLPWGTKEDLEVGPGGHGKLQLCKPIGSAS